MAVVIIKQISGNCNFILNAPWPEKKVVNWFWSNFQNLKKMWFIRYIFFEAQWIGLWCRNDVIIIEKFPPAPCFGFYRVFTSTLSSFYFNFIEFLLQLYSNGGISPYVNAKVAKTFGWIKTRITDTDIKRHWEPGNLFINIIKEK